MSVSINDYLSLIDDELTHGLFRNLVQMNDIIKLFPVWDAGAFVVRGERWATLPTQAFRKLNAQFVDSTGTTEPYEDRLAIWGGAFKVDTAYEELSVPLLQDPAELQMSMHNKSMERQIANEIINGDIDSTPDGFDGLYKRLSSGKLPAAQVISASGTTDSWKVLASKDNAEQFFDKLDEAIYAADLYQVPEATGVPRGALLMNKTSFLGIQQAARKSERSLYTRDLLGYRWKTYSELPLVNVGLQRDKITQIILDTYDPGDAGNDASRIFVVRFAQPDGVVDSPGSDGLQLVQAGSYKLIGPGVYEEYERYVLQWILGLAHLGDDYCVSVLEDFKMAAA